MTDLAGNVAVDSVEVNVLISSDDDIVPVDDEDVDPPQILLSEVDDPVVGEPVIFDASNSVDSSGISSFYWIFGDGTTINSSEAVVTHDYSQSGKYTITLIVTDSYGNENSTSLSLNVNQVMDEDSQVDGVDEIVDDIEDEEKGIIDAEENEQGDSGVVLGDVLTVFALLGIGSYIFYTRIKNWKNI